jgi:hypothetical protein
VSDERRDGAFHGGVCGGVYGLSLIARCWLLVGSQTFNQSNHV